MLNSLKKNDSIRKIIMPTHHAINSEVYPKSTLETVMAYTETRKTFSQVVYARSVDDCLELMDFAKKNGLAICLRSGGYTYGDMILNDREIILNLSGLNKMLSFDSSTGIIVVEPGLRFADIFELILLYNWTLPSCPGGMGVTIGGAISNNVHGKDTWRKGNFGENIIAVKLLIASGEVLTVSRKSDPQLFHAVIGGLGMFGIIIEATIQLAKVPSPYVAVSSVPARDIHESVALLEEAKETADFSVSWVDAFASGSRLGRGFVTTAKWVDQKLNVDEKKLKNSLKTPTRIFGMLPAKPTWFLLRPLFMPPAMRWANKANYHLFAIKDRLSNRVTQRMLFTDYNFMHNKIPDLKHVYRPYGFLEFQPLIPRDCGLKAIKGVFTLCQKHQSQSLLCGMKSHRGDDFMISYSGDGYSIGIDIQVRNRSHEAIGTFARELFQYTLDCRGKAFLSKDEMLSVDMFEKMYPRHREFLEVKRRVDPSSLFASDMYRRLFRP